MRITSQVATQRAERASSLLERRAGMARRAFGLAEREPDEPAVAAPPLGGPLGLHRPAVAPARPAPTVDELCDRILVGRTRGGAAEVRLEVARGGALGGTEVSLVAGARGLEATFHVPTEAARRAVEAQLADLARALDGRGVAVARLLVARRRPTRDLQEER